jgi:hypothetical protein
MLPTTSAPISKQSEATYLDYVKIKEFEDVGYFLINYVVSGGAVTKNVTHNNMIDVSEIVVSLDDNVMHRDGVSFETSTPLATYYLDFTSSGDFTWGNSHPSGTSGVDYLTVAQVTTDASGNVNVITDTRNPFGGFRLSPGFPMPGYVLNPSIADLDMGSHKITNVTSPVNSNDAANKGYVDNLPTYAMPRQALINGNFDVWQRGTSFSNPNGGQYTCDRFKVVNNVDANVKVLQSTSVPNARSKYSARLEVMTSTGGVGSYTQLRQQVEDYSFFAGQKITLSGYAKCDSGASFTPRIYDGVTTQSGSSFNSTTWATFSFTATISASNTDLMIILEFNRSGLAVGVGVNFAQVQVNAGDQSLPFQPRSFAEELGLCQRYYCKTFDYATTPVQASNNLNGAIVYRVRTAGATTDGQYYRFPTRMRIAPTPTFYNPISANSVWRNFTTSADSGSPSYVGLGQNGAFIDNAQVAVDAVSNILAIHAAFDAEI